jgi:hypothetical protein
MRAIRLQFFAPGGETNLYARARLIKPDNTTTIVLLPHVALGVYGANYTPTAPGVHTAIYETFTDSGYTTPSTYDKGSENFTAIGTPLPATDAEGKVLLNHDTGGAMNLAYRTTDDVGIEDAVVRVFRNSVLFAATRTDVDGKWVAPVYVPTGFTYTITFQKDTVYGPDQRSIDV